ncbi:hypothetical protein ACFS5N_00180 [Mucilaginibacter ximonensis]|uniref:Uncharacterized protein n=1 Tax=Mucilaginibacter ximonensis TaxID=538021 RepID=A0ABW5Y739_9SPHI
MKKYIFIVVGILIVGSLFFLSSDAGNLFIHSISETEHIEPGDKLYLKKEFLNSPDVVSTYREVEPISLDSYELIQAGQTFATKEEADERYKKLNFEGNYLIKSFQNIDKSKLKKAGSLYIGTCNKELCYLRCNDALSIPKKFFYKISVNKNIIDNRESLAEMPFNYVWHNDELYVDADVVTKHQ